MKIHLKLRAGFFAFGIATISCVRAADDSASDGWTRLDDNDPAASYGPSVEIRQSGDCFNGNEHLTQTALSWCRFKFNGTGVRWIGMRNDNHGHADIFIDDKLDTTIDAHSEIALPQQVLYEKTGLGNGPHELRIENKENLYQSFDAFEVLGPLPPPPPPKNLGDVTLPAQVPYLNTPQHYPLGNGMGMAVGGATGEWEQLAGPDYTTPNFINSETLSLEVDGVELPLHAEMKRGRETGIYWGGLTRGDLRIYLVDFALRGQPWVTRLVMIDNTSATASHDVRLRANTHPRSETGMSNGFVKDVSGNRCGLFIQADPSVEVPWGGGGETNRSVVIAFSDTAGSAYLRGMDHLMESSTGRIAPNGSWSMGIEHYFRRDKTSDLEALAAIRALKPVPELKQTITEWQKWFRGVAPEYQLSKITDARARDFIEGGLAILKTNQSLDGGIIANSTCYKEGYIRDAELNVRGLIAAGHFDDAKLWLIWTDNVWKNFGHLPDAVGCYAALAKHAHAFDMGNCDMEETAEYLLIARDYYAGTKDLDLLKKLNPSLQYCMDVQLKDAAANGYKLEFNGDETEICSAVDLGATGIKGAKADWSMSSIAMSAAALEFYIEYVGLTGRDPAKYKNLATGTTMDLPAELDHQVEALHRDFWRTDVAGIPDGFHDSFRIKSDNSWPKDRIVNFTLMPIFYGTPYPADEKTKDTAAIAHYFDHKTGFLQMVPGAATGFEGHDLGYLLWALVEVNNPMKDEVYKALLNGPTVDSWGSFNEAYGPGGNRNGHDLRSLETGVNIDAMAKYWKLGQQGNQK
jgi:hypothetical protein